MLYGTDLRRMHTDICTLKHTVTRQNALHCNTLQYTAIRCKTLPSRLRRSIWCCVALIRVACTQIIEHYNTLERTTTHCNAPLQHTAKHCQKKVDALFCGTDSHHAQTDIWRVFARGAAVAVHILWHGSRYRYTFVAVCCCGLQWVVVYCSVL